MIDVTADRRGAALRVATAVAGAVPALAVRLTGVEVAPVAAVGVFGAAVVASVALLMWASEAARVEISGSFALALLALVAILPEYAVDIYFAYAAGHRPEYAAYAAANMTGANRLLIGLAWPLLVAFAAFAARRRGGRPTVTLQAHRRTELFYLTVATAYALVIPLTGRLAWYDAVVLGGLFAVYLWRLRGKEEDEEGITGVAACVAVQPVGRRRALVVALFVTAAVVIVAAAEPFGRALVDTGAALGVDEFLLVQWLAPVASEAPEVIVAITFALRGRADDGMGALLAAKLNQWTLLIACLPVAYQVGGGGFAGLPLDARQTGELVLTAAQTLLGIAVLLDLRLTRTEAAVLLGLFAAQFVLPASGIRYLIAAVYTLLAIGLIVRHRRCVPDLIRAR